MEPPVHYFPFFVPGGTNMGHKTDRERIIDLEHQVAELRTQLDEIQKKIPIYDRIFRLKESYDGRLKKARASLKKIKEAQKKKNARTHTG